MAAVSPTQTNTLAILALVFGVLGSVLGIVFGYLALGQIRRTGQSGRADLDVEEILAERLPVLSRCRDPWQAGLDPPRYLAAFATYVPMGVTPSDS